MTIIVRKTPAGQRALGSMSIRELVLELAALEDEPTEPAGASDGTLSRDTAALATGASARERAIRGELRQRRLALRERA
jgi:hypothetical protein